MGHWQSSAVAAGTDTWEEITYRAVRDERVQLLSAYTSAFSGFVTFMYYPAGAQHPPNTGPAGRDGLVISMGPVSQDYMGVHYWSGDLALGKDEEIRCLFHRTTAADVLRLNVGLR